MAPFKGSVVVLLILLVSCTNCQQEEEASLNINEKDEETDRVAGPLTQYQADSGGYRNNSVPEEAEEDHTGQPHPQEDATEENNEVHENEVNSNESKRDEGAVEPNEATSEAGSVGGASPEGSESVEVPKYVYGARQEEEEVPTPAPAGDDHTPDQATPAGYPQDIGVEESQHNGYNEDAFLYFESKRFKGRNKKIPPSSKGQETDRAAEKPNRNREDIQVTSYVADITDIEPATVKTPLKVVKKPARGDADTISTFFVAARDSVNMENVGRVRKKIVKPIRVRNKLNSNQNVPLYRQKVPLVKPEPTTEPTTLPPQPVTPETSTIPIQNLMEFGPNPPIDHIDLPLDDGMYLPVHVTMQDKPYAPIGHHEFAVEINHNIPKQFENLPSNTDSSLDQHTQLPIQEEENLVTENYPKFPINRLTGKETVNEDKSQTPMRQLYAEMSQGSNTVKEAIQKPTTNNFEDNNHAEDGLTSSDTILAPIQAAVSLSNHVQHEGKTASATTTIEQQEIRVEPVYKTTIEIQKSIPFEIKEEKPQYIHTHISAPPLQHEAAPPAEDVLKQTSGLPKDFLQQVALAYHRLSNNEENQGKFPQDEPQVTTQQPPQNFYYFYRGRQPVQPLYFVPFYKGAHDHRNKGHVGQYILQQSYKNTGLEHTLRPQLNYPSIKYQNLFPNFQKPYVYSNFYDLSNSYQYHHQFPSVTPNSLLGLHKPLQPPQFQHNASQPLAVYLKNVFEQGEEGQETEEPTEEVTTTGYDSGPEPAEAQEQPAEEQAELPEADSQTQSPLAHSQPFPYGYGPYSYTFLYPHLYSDYLNGYRHQTYPPSFYNQPYRYEPLRYYHPYLRNSKGKAPFRPSQPVFASQYPPQTYIVASTMGDRGIHARSINNKKLCIEYGGFKPPLIPSVQIDDEFLEKEAQDKSAKEE